VANGFVLWLSTPRFLCAHTIVEDDLSVVAVRQLAFSFKPAAQATGLGVVATERATRVGVPFPRRSSPVGVTGGKSGAIEMEALRLPRRNSPQPNKRRLPSPNGPSSLAPQTE
jgi:hypothetical protein